MAAWALLGLLGSASLARAEGLPAADAPTVLGPAASAASARAGAELEAGDFEAAVTTVERALKGSALSAAGRTELLRLLGLAELSLGREARATAAYRELVRVNPAYELPEPSPPKARELFAQARRELVPSEGAGPTLMDVAPVGEAAGDYPVPLSVRVVPPPPPGGRVRWSYRRARAATFHAFDLVASRSDPERFGGNLPGYDVPAEPEPYQVEYFVDALDERGHPLASEGSALTPLKFTVRGHAGAGSSLTGAASAWYQSPWVWVVGGVLLAGGAVGLYELAASHKTPSVASRAGLLSFRFATP